MDYLIDAIYLLGSVPLRGNYSVIKMVYNPVSHQTLATIAGAQWELDIGLMPMNGSGLRTNYKLMYSSDGSFVNDSVISPCFVEGACSPDSNFWPSLGLLFEARY